MTDQATTRLTEHIAARLADPTKHKSILEALLDIVSDSGSEGLKKQIKKWVEDVKAKEGIHETD